MAAAYGVDGFSRGSPQKVDNLLQEARHCKDEGNKKYQSDDVKGAIRSYHRSLLYIRSITQGQDSIGSVLGLHKSDSLPAEVQSHITKLTMDIYNNLAACLMKKDNPDYTKIVDYCDKVLAIQPENHKAHYRRGVSFYKEKNYDKALECFLSAKEHMGSEAGTQIKRYITLCYQAIKQQDTQMKTAYKKMFSTVGTPTDEEKL